MICYKNVIDVAPPICKLKKHRYSYIYIYICCKNVIDVAPPILKLKKYRYSYIYIYIYINQNIFREKDGFEGSEKKSLRV